MLLLQTGRSRGFAFVYFEDCDDAVDVSCSTSNFLSVLV